jgi:hypothetical protein
MAPASSTGLCDAAVPRRASPGAGLNPDEVILALAGLCELDPAGDWQTQAKHLYQLVFAGLRPD